jgi:hypothetical protein
MEGHIWTVASEEEGGEGVCKVFSTLHVFTSAQLNPEEEPVCYTYGYVTFLRVVVAILAAPIIIFCSTVCYLKYFYKD